MSANNVLVGGMILNGDYQEIFVNPISGVVTFHDDTEHTYMIGEISIADPMAVDSSSLRKELSEGKLPVQGMIYTKSCVYAILNDEKAEKRTFDKMFTGPGELISIDLNVYYDNEDE